MMPLLMALKNKKNVYSFESCEDRVMEVLVYEMMGVCAMLRLILMNHFW